MCTGWSSLRNKLFIMLFEQTKQHLWHSCCPISLVISNMKFNRKLSEQFWRIWCFPIQSDRSCTWMPESRFKDGRRVTGLVLKRLWRSDTRRSDDGWRSETWTLLGGAVRCGSAYIFSGRKFSSSLVKWTKRFFEAHNLPRGFFVFELFKLLEESFQP